MEHSLSPRGEWMRRALRLFLVFLAGALLQALWFGEAPFARGLRGWEGDNLMFAWNLWWVADSLWAGRDALHVSHVFAPEGFSFLFHTHTALDGAGYAAMLAPWKLGLIDGAGPPPDVAMRLLAYVSGGLTAVAAYLIAGTAGGPRLPRYLAALLVEFCGQRLFSTFGHQNILHAEWLLLSVACVCRGVTREEGGRWWAGAGAFGALSLWNETTYGILAGGVWLLGAVVAMAARRRFLLAVLWTPALMALLASPLLAELVRVFRSDEYFVAATENWSRTDVSSLLLPGGYHPWIGPRLFPWRTAKQITATHGVAFLGWGVTVAAALLAARWRHLARDRWLWFCVALAGSSVVLALGDSLVVLGRELVPAPGRILRYLPGLSNLRAPERFTILAVVSVAALLPRLWTAIPAGRLRASLAVVLVALAASDSLYMRVQTPVGEAPFLLPEPIVAELRSPVSGALWEVPNGFAAHRALWHQTQHARPIVFGAAARVPPVRIERRYGRYPFLAELEAGRAALASTPPPEALRAFLAEFGVRYILVESETPLALEGALAALPARLVAEEGSWRLWRLDPPP